MKEDQRTDRFAIDEKLDAKIINFDKNNVLFSVGDYRNRFLVQDENNINGKYYFFF